MTMAIEVVCVRQIASGAGLKYEIDAGRFPG